MTMYCPVCEKTEILPLFQKEAMPCYNLERHLSRESARKARVGRIDFHLCMQCGAAFNAAFDQRLMDYAVDYENSRSVSPRYRAHLEGTAALLSPHVARANAVVEVGCGGGDFLAALRAHTSAKLYGFDPALPPDPADTGSRIVYKKDYYRDGILENTPDVIILRHILEHQQDPYAFLTPLLPARSAKRPLLYIEVPAWEWIVERKSFYAFSYEHVIYYSKSALLRLLARLGYRVLECRFGFDEEYLQCIAVPDHKSIQPKDAPASLIERSHAFAQAIPGYFAIIRKRFSHDAALWGAAGKGTTLLNLLDLFAEQFPLVADSNPRRARTFIPRTAQEVLMPEELVTHRPSRILLTNSGYRREIEEKLRALEAAPEIIGLDEMLARRS